MSRLSLAQTLPPELLSRIFGWLIEMRSLEVPGGRMIRHFCLVEWPVTAKIPELRVLCLVCQGWRPSAQVLLFRSLRLSQVDLSLLRAILEGQPDLARAVQAVDLGMPSRDELDRLKTEAWDAALQLLSASCNIRHVALTSIPLASRRRLIDFLTPLNLESFVSDARGWTIQRMTGESVLSMFDLEQLAQKPTLRHLASICTPYPLDFVPPFDRNATSVSFLTSLSLSVCFSHNVSVTPLLTLTGSTLTHLQIYTERALNYANFGLALKNHTALQELRITSNVSRDEIDLDWFNEVLPHLASLSKLAVDHEMVHHTVLLQAPPSLKLLEYGWFGNDIEEFLHELSDAFNGARPNYTTFRLIAHIDFENDEHKTHAKEAVRKFERKCAGKNVNLDFHFYSGPRDFPQRTCISFFWCAEPPSSRAC
ncbi:hypothetical protein AAT19DRAFT_11190 [Rhodotorula toruloides]|uniref:F-box domain-containing protein n=2 Tax=Rhodotorula toruloides TaxID=5286 RepID=A0A2S9ZXI4_RHOTO|nr:hypothetical protein AAT19DRAFT_11190 [Rhodotorula toruloides]